MSKNGVSSSEEVESSFGDNVVIKITNKEIASILINGKEVKNIKKDYGIIDQTELDDKYEDVF